MTMLCSDPYPLATYWMRFEFKGRSSKWASCFFFSVSYGPCKCREMRIGEWVVRSRVSIWVQLVNWVRSSSYYIYAVVLNLTKCTPPPYSLFDFTLFNYFDIGSMVFMDSGNSDDSTRSYSNTNLLLIGQVQLKFGKLKNSTHPNQPKLRHFDQTLKNSTPNSTPWKASRDKSHVVLGAC